MIMRQQRPLQAILMTSLFWLSLILAFDPACAKEYVLFETSGEPVEDYNSIVGKLKKNDTVVYSDGSKHVLGKLLGEGGNTKVFELANGKVIRIASSWTNVRFIQKFATGMKVLEQYNAPIPKIDWELSVPNENVILEKLTRLYDFRDFAEWASKGGKYPGYVEAAQQLVEFAQRTSIFTGVADLGGSNLVYTKERGWIALDVMSRVETFTKRSASLSSSEHPLWQSGNEDLFKKLPVDLQTQIRLAIQEGRLRKPRRCASLEVGFAMEQ